MVELNNKWKLDPDKVEVEFLSPIPSGDVEKTVEERRKKFTDARRDILNEKDFSKENEARESLLNTFLLYESVCKESMVESGAENYYLLLSETWKKMRDELNIAMNEVFSLEINGKRLNKGKGESMEHYLMKHAILDYLNKKYGIRDFQEEYSKLKEVIESFAKGEAGEEEWGKIAKRADVYVTLKDGSKLWVEVERTTNSTELKKKLERLKIMLSHFPDLFDKAVFVFPSLVLHFLIAEYMLAEAKNIGFPDDKLEFYEVNLGENRILHIVNPKLIDLEFGDRMLDLIADGMFEPTGKAAKETANKIRERVIKPLLKNKEWEYEFVKSKKEKIKRLVDFWKKHTKKQAFGTLAEIQISCENVKFKEEALPKIKQKYPFLLK